MARRLDEQPAVVELHDSQVHAPPSSEADMTAVGRRILEAIATLPQEEQEAFDLVRIQGLSQAEAARMLGVSTMTVNRRLNHGLQQLTAVLGDLGPEEDEP